MENKKTIDILTIYVLFSSSINIFITSIFGYKYIKDIIEIETIDLILTIFLVNICCVIIIREIYFKFCSEINNKVYNSNKPC